MTAGDTRAVSTVQGPKHDSHDTTKRGLRPATSSDFDELRLRRAQTSASSVEPPSGCFRSLVVCVATVTAIVLSQPAQAITIRVPQDYAKITDALLWAVNGDEIVVSPGVYVENINFNGKNVILRSVNPTDSATVAATIIDGNKKGAVVTFAGTETSSCVLSGFTIRNGGLTGVTITIGGGGIFGHGTKARIEHNTITGNSASGDDPSGGGLYHCNGTIQNNVITNNSSVGRGGAGGGLANCNGTIQNNVITGNSASGYQQGAGGGLANCNGTIQNNVITGNSASGLTYSYGGGLCGCYATIQNNVITSNSASGNVYGYGGGLDDCKGPIRNNTITSNSAKTEGGGLYSCTGAIVSCIIWGNTAPVYSQISNHAIPNYSCIQGYTVGQGQGNIGLNPRFVGPNNFHLLADSPCIDTGTNANCPALDKDGNARPVDGNGDGRAICDIGAYEHGRVAPTAIRPGRWMLYR